MANIRKKFGAHPGEVTGMLPLGDVLGTIDFNVLLMIAGTMGIVSLFIESKMPELLADIVMDKVPNVQWTAVAMSLFAGIISAFVDNVATVLMIAPVALEICKKLKTNPVPFIIAIAVSSAKRVTQLKTPISLRSVFPSPSRQSSPPISTCGLYTDSNIKKESSFLLSFFVYFRIALEFNQTHY